MNGAIVSKRFAQLDSLRAFAVCVVLIHHYRDSRFFLSGFGATLFFVLSGFFATKSLLRLKSGITEGRHGTSSALGTFYFKRWLRLWPLYYLVLGITFLMNVENARSSILWHATFLSNIQVLVTGSWSGRFSPLWSLSVLEQFYLVWPTLILCCPRRHLLRLCLFTIAIAPVYRWGCLVFNAPPLYWCVVPLASFDQLGCGALLALSATDIPGKITRDWIQRFSGLICLPVFLVLIAGKCFDINPPGSAVYINLVASFSFVWLIQRATTGAFGSAKKILENPLLCHVGRISYSIFLLHDFTELLIPKFGFLRPLLESNFKALLLIPATIMLAHIAWRVVESPVLTLRRRYINQSSAPFTTDPSLGETSTAAC